MYGLQLDLLAGLLALTEERARRVAARWRRLGYAETARLRPRRPWAWLRRRGRPGAGGGGGGGAGRPAGARRGALRLLGRGPARGGAGRRGAWPAGAADRDPGPAGGRGARRRGAAAGRARRPGAAVITRYLVLVALRGAARLARRLIRSAVIAAAVVAVAPVSLVAGYSAALGWLLGWPPRRLYAAAAWCLPMVGAWLAAAGLRARPGGALAALATPP